jgi:hypothetical protein
MATTELEHIIGEILEAVETIMSEIASAISTNAAVIAEVAVLGGLAFLMMRFGSRVFSGMTSWIKGFMA